MSVRSPDLTSLIFSPLEFQFPTGKIQILNNNPGIFVQREQFNKSPPILSGQGPDNHGSKQYDQ